MARSPPCVSPVRLQPLPPARPLGFPHRPPESPRCLTCSAWWSGDLDVPRFAFPTPPPGRHGPALCSHLRPRPAPTWTAIAGHGRRGQPRGSWCRCWEAGPGRGWPGGEARDQGLQQGTRLEEVDCSRSPDLLPHSPCPSSQHRHHELAPQEGARGVLSGVARFLLKTALQPQRPSPWAGWTCGRLLVAMSGDRGYRGLSGLGRRKRGSPASVQGRRPSPAVGRPAGEAKRLGLAEATGQGLG